jgi:thioredoxin-related protein
MTTSAIRRSVLQAASIGLVAPRTFAQNASLTLPTTPALDQAQLRAAANHNPLIVMVSLEACPFCKHVREHYLLPLVREQRIDVVQVDMRSQVAIRDFFGNASTHERIIKQWGVRVAPTVLFFGKDGVELAERLKGSYLSDFYGSYLESRLAQARKSLT